MAHPLATFAPPDQGRDPRPGVTGGSPGLVPGAREALQILLDQWIPALSGFRTDPQRVRRAPGCSAGTSLEPWGRKGAVPGQGEACPEGLPGCAGARAARTWGSPERLPARPGAKSGPAGGFWGSKCSERRSNRVGSGYAPRPSLLGGRGPAGGLGRSQPRAPTSGASTAAPEHLAPSAPSPSTPLGLCR